MKLLEQLSRSVRAVPKGKALRLPLAGFLCCTMAALAQNSPCDLSNNGTVDVVDVNVGVNMVLGIQPCTANINGSGVCTVVTVQRVVNAALGQGCVADVISRNVFLDWTASTTSNVSYNVYRSITSGGPYTKLNSAPVAATSYTDTAVPGGLTYFYVATAVNSSGVESTQSNQAVAVVPSQ